MGDVQPLPRLGDGPFHALEAVFDIHAALAVRYNRQSIHDFTFSWRFLRWTIFWQTTHGGLHELHADFIRELFPPQLHLAYALTKLRRCGQALRADAGDKVPQ